MKRFNVLDPENEVFARRFLEASAGTGKTFTIEHLVSRFLLDPVNPLSIEKILVVTFTKAATREMKQRIYSNLLKVQSFLQSHNSADAFPYVKIILEEGQSSVSVALRKIEDALLRFEEAQIFTIHSFCHRILQHCAISAKMGFSAKGQEGQDHDLLLDEQMRLFFRGNFTEKYALTQLENLWRKQKSNPSSFFRSIKKFLEKDVPIKTVPSFEESFSLFTTLIEKIDEVTLDKFLDDYKRLASCYLGMNDPSYLAQATLLGKCLEKKKCSKDEFGNLLQKDCFLEQFVDSNKKAKASFPKDNELSYPRIWDFLKTLFLSVFEEAKNPHNTLMRLSEDLRRLWNEKKETCDIFSHDDLIKKTMQATAHEGFLKEVRELYDAVIVDEFQDTDAQQWKIFKRIFVEGNTRAIYFVGDPKQSIYSFRRADLYTYLEAEDRIGKENKAYLDTNYRSEPLLVDALNTLFSHDKVGEWMRLPSQNTCLAYIPVQSRPGAVNQNFDDGKGSIHFLIGEGTLGRGKNWPTIDMEEKLFFPAFAKEILHLLSKGVKASGIAFLVKDRYQAGRLFTFLQNNKIKAIIKKTGHLQESLAFMPMYNLLKAIFHYEDESVLKKVFIGPYYDFSEEQMIRFAEGFHEKKAFFSELHDLYEKKTLGLVFEKFFSSKGREKSIFSEMVELEDLSFYQDTQQLIEILIDYQNQTGCSLLQLLKYLEKKKFDESEDELWKVRQEEDDSAVTIMTIHVSKGLEFEVVFALGLMYRPKKMDEPIVIKSEGKEVVEYSDLSKDSSKQIAYEKDAEKMRQLYVALTRAKRRLYVPTSFDTKGKDLELSSASPLELFMVRFLDKQVNESTVYEKLPHLIFENMKVCLQELSSQASITFSKLEEGDEKLENKTEKSVFVPSSFRKFVPSYTSKQIFSYSTLMKGHTKDAPAKEAAAAADDENKGMNNLPGGVKTGVMVHAILERIFQKNLHKSFDKTQIMKVVEENLFGTDREPWKEIIVDSLEKLFSYLLEGSESTFCLSDLDTDKAEVEMEFLYPEKGQLCKGSIDLVFEKDGKYYFVDWKTNVIHENDSLEEVMKRGDYFLQASIYRKALEKYLAIFEKRSFEECFGGCFYLFLRETKAYHFFPQPLEEHLEGSYARD